MISYNTDTDSDENRRDADGDSEAVSVLVEEFLERGLLSEGVAEKASRHHAAGNHPEALQLILDSRRN